MRLDYSGKWRKMRHPENWLELHESATVVDLHAHSLIKAAWFGQDTTIDNPRNSWLGRLLDLDPFELDPLTVRTDFPKLKRGGVDVMLATAYAFETESLPDYNLRFGRLRDIRWKHIQPWMRIFLPRLYREHIAASPFESTQTMFAVFERELERLRQKAEISARTVSNATDLHGALASGDTIAIVRALEGGHNLEGPQTRAIRQSTRYADVAVDKFSQDDQDVIEAEVMANLERMAEGGLAYITLAHFYPNTIATSAFPYPERIFDVIARERFEWTWRDLTEGLTQIGQKVVRRMFEMGICVDLCHTTPTVRKQVYALAVESGRPELVIFSHAGVYAHTGNPYNPYDWEIRWIAEHGGVIGVIFSNYVLAGREDLRLGLGSIAQTMAHLHKVGGIEVIGIGTDLDGFSNPPDDIPDISALHHLTQRLLVEDFLSEHDEERYSQIRKILGGNAMRVLTAALSYQAT